MESHHPEDPLQPITETLRHLLAYQVYLTARHDALAHLVIQSLKGLGVDSHPGHPGLSEGLRQLEQGRCNDALAELADSDPNMATALKSILAAKFQ